MARAAAAVDDIVPAVVLSLHDDVIPQPQLFSPSSLPSSLTSLDLSDFVAAPDAATDYSKSSAATAEGVNMGAR